MSKEFIYKIFAFVSIILGIGAVVLILEGSWASIIYAQTERPNLTLNLASPKSSYLQLETIPLTFKLSNRTTQPVKWQGIFTFGSDMDLIIQPSGGQEKIIEGRMLNMGALVSAPATMQTGQEIESGAIIDGVSLFEKAFPSPGTYQVRVKFRYEKIDGDRSSQETVLSNPVTINIAAPQGIDLEAYNYIKNTLERARRDRVSRASTEELVAFQKNFVDTYSTSVYAKQQIWKLAVTYQALGDNLKAVRELCRLSNDNTYYSEQVQRLLYSIDVKLHPIDTTPLPENVPTPVRPHPCSRLLN